MRDYEAPTLMKFSGNLDEDLQGWEVFKRADNKGWRATWRRDGRRTDLFAERLMGLLLQIQDTKKKLLETSQP